MEDDIVGKPIIINGISPEFMSIEGMKKCINMYLDKSDSVVRTLYEVLFLKGAGHEVEIRVGESDFTKEVRRKRKLNLEKKRREHNE
ncbi:MAG: hypothetical protein ABGF52_11365 [Candidatus Asgardarchaeum sp.]